MIFLKVYLHFENVSNEFYKYHLHTNKEFDMILQNDDSKIGQPSPEICKNFLNGRYGSNISSIYYTQLFPEIVTRWNNHREQQLKNENEVFILFSCDCISSWPSTLAKLPVSPIDRDSLVHSFLHLHCVHKFPTVHKLSMNGKLALLPRSISHTGWMQNTGWNSVK